MLIAGAHAPAVPCSSSRPRPAIPHHWISSTHPPWLLLLIPCRCPSRSMAFLGTNEPHAVTKVSPQSGLGSVLSCSCCCHAGHVPSQATQVPPLLNPRLSFRSPASSNDACNGGASVCIESQMMEFGILAPGLDHSLNWHYSSGRLTWPNRQRPVTHHTPPSPHVCGFVLRLTQGRLKHSILCIRRSHLHRLDRVTRGHSPRRR